MKLSFSLFLTLLLFHDTTAASKPAVALVVEDDSELSNYDFIGEYDVQSIVKVDNGETRRSPIQALRYRVYSNGSEIRLFQESILEAYHTYSIYRSDGITEVNNQGQTVVRPGIQARQVKADLVKQLSLTQQKLTITEFPPLSNTVVITFAKRVNTGK